MRSIARAICMKDDRPEGRGMIERVLSLPHSTIALGEKPGVYAASNQRKGFAAVKDASLRLLRKLGDFFAAGGPLS